MKNLWIAVSIIEAIIIIALLFRSPQVNTKYVITSDKGAIETIDRLNKEKEIIKDSLSVKDSLLKISESKEPLIRTVYVKVYNDIHNATLGGKDSMLRASTGINK